MTTVTWTGKSGIKYQLYLHPLSTEFKPLGGVYIFCRPGQPGFMEAVYVGQTQSFFDRLNANPMNHDGYKRARLEKATHVAVLVEANATLRLRIETDLRHGLDPICNVQNVPTESGLLR